MTDHYDRISWFRIAVSGLMLAFGMLLAGHWFWHPGEEHPSAWIIGLCLGLGAIGLLPFEVEVAFKYARELLPWKAAVDRRQTCGTCGHPAHPAAPCSVPTEQGECGCIGQ